MTVILSIGRHECYGKGSLPLSPEGISGAWLSAEIIARQCGRPQKIISSPLPRAVLTAELRRLAWQESDNIVINPLLHEDSGQNETEMFKILCFEEALAQNDTHIHLVTHQPTATRLNDMDFTPLNPGDVMVWEAADWNAMQNGEIKKYFVRPNAVIQTSQALRAQSLAIRNLAEEADSNGSLMQKLQEL